MATKAGGSAMRGRRKPAHPSARVPCRHRRRRRLLRARKSVIESTATQIRAGDRGSCLGSSAAVPRPSTPLHRAHSDSPLELEAEILGAQIRVEARDEKSARAAAGHGGWLLRS